MHAGFADSTTVDVGPIPGDVAGFVAACDRLGARLVELLARGVQPANRLLEVGCGRGANLAVLAPLARQRFALDLIPAAVAAARRFDRADSRDAHHTHTLFGIAGDAVVIPLRSDSLDLIVNIESSGCYADRSAFFRECRRVARSGARFLYADMYPAAALGSLHRELEFAGWDRDREVDLTAGAARAARQMLSWFVALAPISAAPELATVRQYFRMLEFVARQLDSGQLTYFGLQLRPR
jgi:SAM-dependent methyltransferase